MFLTGWENRAERAAHWVSLFLKSKNPVVYASQKGVQGFVGSGHPLAFPFWLLPTTELSRVRNWPKRGSRRCSQFCWKSLRELRGFSGKLVVYWNSSPKFHSWFSVQPKAGISILLYNQGRNTWFEHISNAGNSTCAAEIKMDLRFRTLLFPLVGLQYEQKVYPVPPCHSCLSWEIREKLGLCLRTRESRIAKGKEESEINQKHVRNIFLRKDKRKGGRREKQRDIFKMAK